MSEPSTQPYCRNCRWYDPEDNEALGGLCRVYAPVMQGVIAPHGDAQFQNPGQAIWPRVNADDWCGCFVAFAPSPKDSP